MYAHLVAVSLVLSAVACQRGEPPTPPAAIAWPEPRTLDLPSATGAKGRVHALVLRYEPPSASAAARVRLELDGATAWSSEVGEAQRDALFSATYRVAAEPAPGRRLALSSDGGARFRVILPAPDGPHLCAHAQVPAVDGQPDWSKLPSPTDWAAGVLQTAVWGCDAQGRGCESRSLVGGVAHHSEPAADFWAQPRIAELRLALAEAERAALDRRLAVALIDAAVNYQQGLDQADLERLGRLAGKALSPAGPIAPEERRALTLRVSLARSEAKTLPPEQISPRVSIAALERALEFVAKDPINATQDPAGGGE